MFTQIDVPVICGLFVTKSGIGERTARRKFMIEKHESYEIYGNSFSSDAFFERSLILMDLFGRLYHYHRLR